MTEQLKLAVSFGDENIVGVFLQLGADVVDVNARTGERRLTLLLLAVRNNNESVARMLLQHGADVNAASDDGLTALHVAVANRSLTMVELLLEFNVDVNPKSKFLGKTPLFMAVEYGCLEIAELLLRKGASVREATIRNTTILHVALRVGEPRLARLVLSHAYKEHIDLPDNIEGKSPLHLAVERQHHDIVKTLLQKGANIDQICQKSTDESYDPLSLAINCKDDKMAALLLQNGATKSAGECLHRAIKQRCLGIAIRLLRSKIVEVDHVGSDGFTALQIAVMSGYRDMVVVCLEYGASLTPKLANKVPLLYFAIKNGDAAMVDLLIKEGASIHAPVARNISLLDVAVKRCNAQLTSHLLNRGSIINVNSSLEEQVFVIKRIAILTSEKKKISDKNLQLIKTRPLWSRLYERCQEEIECTKSDKLSGSISFYDVLTKDDDILATYAGNEEYLSRFAKTALKKKYRIYADSLAQNFTRGRVRQLLLQRASGELKKIGMEATSAQRVLRALSNEDLKSFIKGVCKCATDKHRCLPQLYVANCEGVTGCGAF